TAFLVTRAYSYIGASARINLWSPFVEAHDEYTTAQIWLLNGPRFAFESVESGWTVNPAIYGDKSSRFFVYWSADGSQKTGCFDLMCHGFVQTNHEIALGGKLNPISWERGGQYHLPISIHLDTNTSAWWLASGKTFVGYWPGDLFYALHDSASLVQFGGEVFSPLLEKLNAHHTATAMGSGNFAIGRFGHAAFINHVRITDYSKVERYPEWVYAYMDEPYCYSALNHVEYIKEPQFYFGGPGRNRLCP
ncbi:hypothetical protein MKW94_010897, partial [Papaver nudicaule]|nr:hypothetical protein [Papaver nudicaule]